MSIMPCNCRCCRKHRDDPMVKLAMQRLFSPKPEPVPAKDGEAWIEENFRKNFRKEDDAHWDYDTLMLYEIEDYLERAWEAGRQSGLAEAVQYVKWKKEALGSEITPVAKMIYEEAIRTILTADMPRSTVD